MYTTLILQVAVGVIVLTFITLHIRTEHRLKRLLAGKNARTLEDTIFSLEKEVRRIQEENALIREHLITVDERLRRTIRNVETVRFNPFSDQGSNQSFATAFLNDDGDGVVISSLYARDRMSIFAKPISKRTSSFELTNEEKEVITKAAKS